MRMGVTAAVVVVAAGAGFGAGRISSAWSNPAVSRPVEQGGAVVVTYDGGALSSAEVLARLKDAGYLTVQSLSRPEELRQHLLDEVRGEVMADRAVDKGYHLEPEFVRGYRRQLAEQYRQRELAPRLEAIAISDADVAAYFEQHRREWAREETVQVAHVFLAWPAEQEKRAAVQREARSLLEQVRRDVKRDVYAFGRLAEQRSAERDSARSGGMLPSMTQAALTARLGAQVAAAAAQLAPGEVYPSPVEGPGGLHLVRLVARSQGFEPTLEAMRERIKQRLLTERRRKASEELVASVDASAAISVDDAALRALAEEIARRRASASSAPAARTSAP